jgi:dipeptidyl aminopeptidase/acylaminoacyl peptidase
MMQKLLLILLTMALLPPVHAQQVRLTPALLWKVGRLGLDDVSPDQRLAVYGVQHYDMQHNKGTRALYVLNLETGASRLLTPRNLSCADAAFTPDGRRIGFVADGKLQEIPVEGGSIQQVYDGSINGFRYSPDGRHILFAMDVNMDRTAADIHPDLPKTSGRVIDGLFYRHWKSWHDYAYSNILYAPYSEGRLSSEPKNIMNEPYDSPLRPMGGMEQVAWSPNGKFIVYACRKLSGTREALSTNADLYLYELASGQTVNMTEDLKGYDLDPVFSPDGNYLAWSSMERAGYEADRTRIMVMDLRTNERRELTRGWDYEGVHPQWSADSRSIFFSSSTDYTYQLYEWPLDAPKPRRITTGQHDIKQFAVAGNQIVGTRTAMDAPAELYSINPSNGQMRRLTNATDDPWATVAMGKVERRSVRTQDGKDMNVWVVYPPDFDPKQSYPSILYCQGGPQSALSQGFSYRWNVQLMAAEGYVVIAPCRRGMPGSGQAWCDAIIGDWSGMPMQDLLSAADALAKEPWIDKKRMAAAGASFGGFSVYWLAGHHEKRFKAFIAHCGLFNLESWYGTTEELFFANNDLKGPYWRPDLQSAYAKGSPHRYVDKWDTPLLVIHNELDYRVPVSEGMQAFQAAQLRNIPSQFLYFPDEGHWVTKPQNSLLWQRTFFAFLTEHLSAP